MIHEFSLRDEALSDANADKDGERKRFRDQDTESVDMTKFWDAYKKFQICSKVKNR